MVLYLAILLFLVIGFYLLLTLPSKQIAAFVVNAGPVVLIIIGLVLTLFRRGAIGFPLMIMGFSWWRRNRSKRPIRSAQGQKSTVRSANLEMELDHDTGDMDGTILTGRLQGSRLSSLSEEELLSLYVDFRSDPESLSLLEAFLDRYVPDWRDRADSSGSGTQNDQSAFDHMTREEAYQILGLEPKASQEEIHQAWRRLIKGVHPDSGGSDFLAAKINTARDILLK
ncbi:MAG: DnaJ domain-containing protein [Desulfuromonadales bacterium]|nr:DnaJ domain-containing protein [Desulfuromonadales bacterium]MBN2791112.1 DnaJ domain-containing protein [Desulfuromonadales bacterium]